MLRASIILVVAGCVAGCEAGSKPVVLLFSGATMGTSYHIKAAAMPGATVPEELGGAIQALLDDLDGKMSTYKPDSELSRFNAAQSIEPFQVSPETAEVVRAALDISRRCGGVFDITVGPLVNAWGFGPAEEAAPPSEEEIAALRSRVGYAMLEVGADNTLRKQRPDMYCDLGAIAQGYASDKIAEMFEARGLHNYMIEISGEVRASGVNAEGQPWRIGIERPDLGGGPIQKVVPLDGKCLATSGDYRNYREVDGKRLSHEIDPRTGKPIAHGLASATAIHESCAWADACATALMVLGPEEGLAWAEREGLPAYLIVHEEGGGFAEKENEAFRKIVAGGAK